MHHRRGSATREAPSLKHAWRRLEHSAKAWLYPATDYEHNEHILYLQVIPQGLFIGGAMAFVDVFLVRLGAPNWLVSLGASLPSLVMMLAVLPMGAWIQRRNRLLHDYNLARLLSRSAYSLMALAPFLPAVLAPFALVALRVASALPSSAQSVCFGTVMGKATLPKRRARMLSGRWAMMRVSMAVVGFAVGIWLENVAFPLNYQVLFATSIVSAGATVYVLSKLRLAPDPAPSASDRDKLDLRAIPALIARIPRFRDYISARLLLQIGISLGISLLPIYRVRTLGASDAWLGVLLTIENISQVVSYIILGRLLRRQSFRKWLWLSAIGMALLPLSTGLATRPEMLVLPSLVVGVFGAALNVFLMDELIVVSPEADRPMLVSINTFVVQTISFVGPMLGTALAGATTIRVALFASAAFRAIGGAAFWWLGTRRRTRTS